MQKPETEALFGHIVVSVMKEEQTEEKHGSHINSQKLSFVHMIIQSGPQTL